MKRILSILALGVLFSAHKCNEGEAATMASLVDTKWQLQSLNGKAIELPSGAQTPWLMVTKPTEYKFEGFGGCNKLMGSFQMDGDRIGFPNLGGTKMFCEKTSDLEKRFVAALSATDSYKIDDGVLKLMQGGTEMATLIKG